MRSGTRLTFNHANETAEAGYCGVGLDNGGDTYGAEVHVVGNDAIEGFVRAGNCCTTSTTDRYLVYFSARFDRPFASFGT